MVISAEHRPKSKSGAARAPLRARAFPTETLTSAIPKRWIADSVLSSHLANGVNLLFPAGERFFVRSVRHYLDRISDDPVLVEAVRGFAAQEGHHARAHEKMFAVLEEQGYRIKPYLRVYEAIAYSFIERICPPVLRLSVTAAAEHFTAVLAENFLRDVAEAPVSAGPPVVDPAMLRLFRWHAIEEIEHRAVAFDVLARVDGRYAIRMAGLAMGSALLAGFWLAGTAYLVAQEPDSVAAIKRELAGMRGHHPFGERVFGRGIRAYIARDFHPHDNHALDELAARALVNLET